MKAAARLIRNDALKVGFSYCRGVASQLVKACSSSKFLTFSFGLLVLEIGARASIRYLLVRVTATGT